MKNMKTNEEKKRNGKKSNRRKMKNLKKKWGKAN